MIKIDLITGFLGSGKTTFLKQYAKYLMAQGKNIDILENDFGAVNVDMLLLQELRGDQCELEMISGGCDKETHRRRFRTKLISMGMSGYDRILVEPSGIYDVDEFFDTLYDEPLNRWYEAGSVITILDAGLDEKLSEEEEYLLASEAANAGKIVLSKVQNVSEEKKEETIAHLNRTLEQAGCRRQFSDAEILQKNWDDLTEDDFKMLSECNYRSEDYRKLDFGEQQTFDSLCFLEPKITEEALKGSRSNLCGFNMRQCIPDQRNCKDGRNCVERNQCDAGTDDIPGSAGEPGSADCNRRGAFERAD